MKKRSSKLNKLERNRFSIITNDLDHCILCGKTKNHLHEVIYGKNRLNSIKYGLVIPLCFNCHNAIHNDIKLDLAYKKIAQDRFVKHYPELDFLSIFHKNYL